MLGVFGSVVRRRLVPTIGVTVAVTAAMTTASASSSSAYSEKHVRVTATFADVKDIRLKPLPVSADAPSFAASTLWENQPCVIVVMRRPG